MEGSEKVNTFYTDERNIQILIYLLKENGIKKVIASPGTTNLTLVASLQQDSYFEIYSSADERSAAYIACGMAAESGETVVLTCTGATASRNYVSALTEAYYRKLPILAITSTQHAGRVGHNVAQVIDRSVCMNDIVNYSIQVPSINSEEDEWACIININKAILELRRHGGGPVHINLATTYSRDFSIKELPKARVISRIAEKEHMPNICAKEVAIYVGEHGHWTEQLAELVDIFCEKYNGVVLCDQSSNYKGKYRVLGNIISSQKQYKASCRNYDLMIHIGGISGVEISTNPAQVWRVNSDGEIRDTFKKLTTVFEMSEEDFFKYYVALENKKEEKNLFLDKWKSEYNRISSKIPELPFSNMWIAQHTAGRLPENSILHLGILNSLRCWSFFEVPDTVDAYSNVGGFGIDGNISSLIGASLVHKEKLYFGIVGDLSFFYDMNSLGNRHIGNNIRLMLVNNGRGTEFRNYNHPAAKFGDDADMFMAAAGHYGNKNRNLVRHYAEDLGYEYLCASNKEDYLKIMERFISPDKCDKSIIFEVFTDSQDESEAIRLIHNIEITTSGSAKAVLKNVIGEEKLKRVKKFIKR